MAYGPCQTKTMDRDVNKVGKETRHKKNDPKQEDCGHDNANIVVFECPVSSLHELSFHLHARHCSARFPESGFHEGSLHPQEQLFHLHTAW